MTRLNDVMDFDHVIRVRADRTIDERPEPAVYAPDLLMSVHADGQILDDDERDYISQAKAQGWTLESGWTAQYGYRGVVMHPSEYIGGALADHIRATPGLWVAITVETDDGSEDSAGWAIAYRAEE
jgi:hypothetical protein